MTYHSQINAFAKGRAFTLTSVSMRVTQEQLGETFSLCVAVCASKKKHLHVVHKAIKSIHVDHAYAQVCNT